MSYTPAAQRYETMKYRFCGRSGLKLPVLSLGLWHNFGSATPWDNQRAIVRYGIHRTTSSDRGEKLTTRVILRRSMSAPISSTSTVSSTSSGTAR